MVLIDHAFIDVSGDFHSDSSEGPLSVAHLDQPPVLISKTPIVLTLEDDQNFSKLPQRNRDLHLWAMSAHPLRPTADTAAECIAAGPKLLSPEQYPPCCHNESMRDH